MSYRTSYCSYFYHIADYIQTNFGQYDQVDVEKARLIMDDSFSVTEELVSGEPDRVVLEPQNPVACWREASLHLCVAPVLVCKVCLYLAHLST